MTPTMHVYKNLRGMYEATTRLYISGTAGHLDHYRHSSDVWCAFFP
ncbi:hypothetical protein QWZ13_05000 [Reinekea marina]|nr:hypothetical protein [Reinekea marina]MDN3648265.1 hypothetical protein [Reinekea marina]